MANVSVSVVSAAAAMASLDDEKFVTSTLAKTVEARKMCMETFTKLSLEFIPSNTNFMLFNIDPVKKDLIKEMEANNIFVQSRNHFNGKWCRVTMGTIEEMQSFCNVLKTIV